MIVVAHGSQTRSYVMDLQTGASRFLLIKLRSPLQLRSVAQVLRRRISRDPPHNVVEDNKGIL
jgi:hypothetical protein